MWLAEAWIGTLFSCCKMHEGFWKTERVGLPKNKTRKIHWFHSTRFLFLFLNCTYLRIQANVLLLHVYWVTIDDFNRNCHMGNMANGRSQSCLVPTCCVPACYLFVSGQHGVLWAFHAYWHLTAEYPTHNAFHKHLHLWPNASPFHSEIDLCFLKTTLREGGRLHRCQGTSSGCGSVDDVWRVSE